MSRHLNNQLLARLDPESFASISQHLAVISLKKGHVLAETHAIIQKVYFPHSGIISCVVELEGGGAIETGMIGKDGQFGAGPALDHKASLNLVVTQVAGEASVIRADRFKELAEQLLAIRSQVLAYEQFFLAQVQQTAACNALHTILQRTCRWLLRMEKLVGSELPLTQEFLAQMMGVRRTSVTEVASEMQRLGLIRYHRGLVRIVDLVKIRTVACECDDAVNAHYARAFDQLLPERSEKSSRLFCSDTGIARQADQV